MQPESLEVLEKAEVPPAQARAIVRAIEIEIVGARDTLATTSDLLLLRRELGDDMGALRRDVGGRLTDQRQHVSKHLADLRQEFAELRARQDVENARLREAMASLAGQLRAEIHASASRIERQMYTALLGQTAVLLGFGYFFATHVR